MRGACARLCCCAIDELDICCFCCIKFRGVAFPKFVGAALGCFDVGLMVDAGCGWEVAGFLFGKSTELNEYGREVWDTGSGKLKWHVGQRDGT